MQENIIMGNVSHLPRAAVLVLTFLSANIAWAQTINLHFNPRPPYMFVKDGVLSGLTGSSAVAALTAAGIRFEVHETPATRFLEAVKANQSLDCGVGWFKNPDREGFAKFTKPIYQDEPQLILIAADNPKIGATDTIEAILANPDLNLLVKQSYSYGKGLDALIEKHRPRLSAVSAENIQMFKMIQSKRADYMFTAPEEAAATIVAAGLSDLQFKQVRPAGMPKGEFRYLMCSKSVPDDLLNRLNAAIR